MSRRRARPALQRTARWERAVITVTFLDADVGLKTRVRDSAWQRVSPHLTRSHCPEVGFWDIRRMAIRSSFSSELLIASVRGLSVIQDLMRVCGHQFVKRC
jgi:hypothetical protein